MSFDVGSEKISSRLATEIRIETRVSQLTTRELKVRGDRGMTGKFF